MIPDSPRILIIGIGPHARRFYAPNLKAMESEGKLRVVGMIDLMSQQQVIDAWLAKEGLGWPMHYLPPFREPIPADVSEQLSKILETSAANAVIISTDPLSHKLYALWALRNRLNILLDKPVTTAVDAVSSLDAANRIAEDYEDVSEARATHYPRGTFILCSHRRFHPGIDYAMDMVREVSAQTGCPATNIHGYHSDGQWRLPSEIISQEHHSYHHGHGKISHSGFHFLDTLYRFRKAGAASGKSCDQVCLSASFLKPEGFLEQITRADYRKLFGADYDRTFSIEKEEQSQEQFAKCGEMDVEASFEFQTGGKTAGLASISLLHGGFSRRSWLHPGADLYKGNGRVKHEAHRIHVGPFLSINIFSYQAKDKHDQSGEEDELPGGNNHFELWIFRNAEIIGGKPFEKLQFHDLPTAAEYRSDELFIEQVKRGAIVEFLSAMKGASDLRSDFSDHAMPVRLISALYRSHVSRTLHGNPLITMPWKEVS